MTNVHLDYKLRETHLSIVLLDLIGSTAFVQKVGPVKAARWLQYHDRLARSLCYRFNAREIDRSDGFLLSFEKVIDAVNFALKYQETVPAKTHLGCRIGVHWGRVVEVHQHELNVGIGVKQVELEGVAKNIAARTMSICRRGQVLLTKEAMNRVRGRSNMHTPKNTRYACVGLYLFKGIREPQEVYSVGTTLDSLQPPKGGGKVKRLGGPKKIKKRARDKAIFEWVSWVFWRAGFVSIILWIWVLVPILIDPIKRGLLGVPYTMPILDKIVALIYTIIGSLE